MSEPQQFNVAYDQANAEITRLRAEVEALRTWGEALADAVAANDCGFFESPDEFCECEVVCISPSGVPYCSQPEHAPPDAVPLSAPLGEQK